jgi:hypothetical protein
MKRIVQHARDSEKVLSRARLRPIMKKTIKTLADERIFKARERFYDVTKRVFAHAHDGMRAQRGISLAGQRPERLELRFHGQSKLRGSYRLRKQIKISFLKPKSS